MRQSARTTTASKQRLPVREPAALLGLRPARGLLAADPDRGPRRRCAASYPPLRRSPTSRATSSTSTTSCEAFVDAALQAAARTTTATPSTSAPARKTTIGERRRRSARELFGDRREPAASRCRSAALGRARLVRQPSEGAREVLGLAGAHAASTRACERTAEWYRDLPDPEQLPQRVEAVRRSTRSTASRRSSPATRTARRSPSCTERLNETFDEARASTTRSSSSTTAARTTARRSIREHQRARPRACSASRTRATSARRRPSAAAWSSPRKNAVRAAGRRSAGPARADRAVRRPSGARATTSSTAAASSARRRSFMQRRLQGRSTASSTASRISRSRATPATSR